MRLKKNVFALVVVVTTALGLSGIQPSMAATKSVTLDMTSYTMPSVTGVQAGDTVNLKISGLSGSDGVYASLCRADVNSLNKATVCDTDQSHMAWITVAGGQGSASASAGGNITAVNAFGDVNCLVDTCVIYVRGDHNNLGAYQLIRKISVSFVTGGAVKAKDSATGTASGITMTPNVPHDLTYRSPVVFSLVAASGLKIKLTSLTPDCAVSGMKVTALAGESTCAIAATTAGNDTYAPLNVNFPFYTHPLPQTITMAWPSATAPVKSVVKINRNFSNLRVPVSLTVSNSAVCKVRGDSKRWYVSLLAVGSCELTATAAADKSQARRWTSRSDSFTVTVTSAS